MKLELFISGVGGQGVQLLSKTLGKAAMADGEPVMLMSEYGGEMRGGSSKATLVIGDGVANALPVLPSSGTAIALHHRFWERTAPRLRSGALVVADELVADQLVGIDGCRLVRIAGTEIAAAAGNPMAMALAMAGAYAAITGAATTDSMVAAMTALIPPYRTQHLKTNEAAIRMGAEAGHAAHVGAPSLEAVQ